MEHASAQQDVSAAEQQLVASADTVLSLEEAMRAAERRYAFVQGLRQYLAVLCDFLKVRDACLTAVTGMAVLQ